MSIGAELGQYILQTHTSKKSLKIQWGGLNPWNPTLGTPVVDVLQRVVFLQGSCPSCHRQH